MNEDTLCVCGAEYGDHLAKPPHARLTCGHVVCVEFREPLTEDDLPDFWVDMERLMDRGEKQASAESAAADRLFQVALTESGAFDLGLPDV